MPALNSGRLSPFQLSTTWGLFESDNDDLFTGNRAEIVVQAPHLDARGLLNHLVQDRSRRFNEMGSDLFDQVPAFLGRKRLGQMLLGRRQNPRQADDQQVA